MSDQSMSDQRSTMNIYERSINNNDNDDNDIDSDIDIDSEASFLLAVRR